ncbi:hypothetical protein [Burkholderia guangdongensis]|uniref:hypothetical protein n=1 Tax=Burkholderia guangdongensis TaxID=1792500 RepID=UPI0015C91C53|nr:hypothetical protein [Burkholderia guangdongensis]
MKPGRHSGARRAFVTACLLAAGSLATRAFAAAPANMPPDDDAPAKPLKPNPAFAHLQRYEGTLGGRPIVVHLGPKDDESGVHGEYQFKDTGEVVLLAGDRDGDTLEIEESNDGTNITGVWVGRFDDAGGLSADRMNADESDPQPVVLKPVGASRSALQVRDGGRFGYA